MNANKKVIKGNIAKPSSVLGTFTGKCCDSNVFNNNDMHLGRDVFETLKASDEYKRAMQNRHYIGFLGHPSDMDCQEYEHACIVMTDMRILDNGEIEGDFDLIDTPVGKVVKSFIDAGVKFGISIRGLGEVDSNGEVDPEQFIFRGFDLVTFPAYDDCIPEFKEIAASTDAKKKAAYKKICASINANIKDIKSCEALQVIQAELPEDSDEFKLVQDQIDSLSTEEPVVVVDEADPAIVIDVMKQKLDAVTALYLEAQDKNKQLETALAAEQVKCNDLAIECKTLNTKQARLSRITSAQIKAANESVDKANEEVTAAKKAAAKARKQFIEANSRLNEIKQSYDKEVIANTRMKERLASLNEKHRGDIDSIKASNDLNLKYQRKIEANSEAISQKDSTIEELRSKLNETVIANQDLESKASNLDEERGELLSRVEAAEEMVSAYQQAYANMYANALGVYLTGLPVTASTSVEELRHMITAGTSTANIPASPSYYNLDDEEVEESEDIEGYEDDTQYSADLVSM